MDFLNNLSPERQKDFWELMSQETLSKLEHTLILAKAKAVNKALDPSEEHQAASHNATADMVKLLFWASEIIKDVREAAGMPVEEPYYLMGEEEGAD